MLALASLCTACWWVEPIDEPDYPHSEPHPDYKSELWYTTTDGQPIEFTKTSGFGLDIVDMTYADGRGVIVFDGIVRRIGAHAFEECENLRSISLPDSTRLLDRRAFARCANLEEVILPDCLMAIDDEVFASCGSLTSIYIPERVETFGEHVFAKCGALREFKGDLASEDGRTVIIDSCIVAFAPDGIEEYRLPEEATTIASWVFAQCDNLRKITIPDNITAVGVGAFAYCYNIEEITFGEGVTVIESECMRDCMSLTSVYMKPMTPPTIDLTTFSTHNYELYRYEYLGCDIYVPHAALSTYRESAVWRDYAEYIKAPGTM